MDTKEVDPNAAARNFADSICQNICSRNDSRLAACEDKKCPAKNLNGGNYGKNKNKGPYRSKEGEKEPW